MKVFIRRDVHHHASSKHHASKLLAYLKQNAIPIGIRPDTIKNAHVSYEYDTRSELVKVREKVIDKSCSDRLNKIYRGYYDILSSIQAAT